MATIRIDQRLDASPDEVWKVIADYGNIADWFPGIDESSAEGMTRTCKFGDVDIEEEIVTCDDDLRRLQYRITGGPMVPEFHLATVDIHDFDGKTLLVYSCDVEPDEAKDILEPALQGGVDALKERFGG